MFRGLSYILVFTETGYIYVCLRGECRITERGEGVYMLEEPKVVVDVVVVVVVGGKLRLEGVEIRYELRLIHPIIR